MESADGLEYGTRVRTKLELEDTKGFIIAERHIKARKANALGLIGAYVPGHGGDVWFVRHSEGDARSDPCPVAAYYYGEFELA